jgi:hypothetical protein
MENMKYFVLFCDISNTDAQKLKKQIARYVIFNLKNKKSNN